jgi:hypothetical protein
MDDEEVGSTYWPTLGSGTETRIVSGSRVGRISAFRTRHLDSCSQLAAVYTYFNDVQQHRKCGENSDSSAASCA